MIVSYLTTRPPPRPAVHHLYGRSPAADPNRGLGSHSDGCSRCANCPRVRLPDPDTVERRCRQLVDWGNLVRSVREARVPSVAASRRSRSRYQVSKLGGRLHREAEEILRAVDGAREVARELLARIVESL